MYIRVIKPSKYHGQSAHEAPRFTCYWLSLEENNLRQA